jgi:nitronate monooxygenase
MKAEQLDIPLIAAGGIFTGSDAVGFLEKGVAGVQVATRFTITHECGLPDDVKQEYLPRQRGRHHRQRHLADRLSDAHAEADAGDRLGHPSGLRILRLPARCDRQLRLHQFVQPRSAGQSGPEEHPGVRQDLPVHPHAQLQLLDLRPTTYRLKDTTHKLADGKYQILSAEHVFKDYQFSVDNQIALPPRQEEAAA